MHLLVFGMINRGRVMYCPQSQDSKYQHRYVSINIVRRYVLRSRIRAILTTTRRDLRKTQYSTAICRLRRTFLSLPQSPWLVRHLLHINLKTPLTECQTSDLQYERPTVIHTWHSFLPPTDITPPLLDHINLSGMVIHHEPLHMHLVEI